MSKLVLYIFEGGELEEVIEGLKNIKKYIVDYENRPKRGITKVQRDSSETQCTCSDSD